MEILIDTRQKKDKHDNVDVYFLSHKIEVVSKPLNVGDYMLSEDAKVTVDSKSSLYELCCDLFSRNEKARFQRECKRAKKLGITLYILIEQNFNKEKLLKWKSQRKSDGTLITKATGKSIYGKMQIYSLMFGVKWRFCRKKDTGKTILKLLGAEKDD